MFVSSLFLFHFVTSPSPLSPTMALPPDRGHLRTEHRHQRSLDLDDLDTAGCARLMVEDHAAVCRAVAAAERPLVALIDGLVTRMRSGGRLIYVGAGTSGRLGALDVCGRRRR